MKVIRINEVIVSEAPRSSTMSSKKKFRANWPDDVKQEENEDEENLHEEDNNDEELQGSMVYHRRTIKEIDQKTRQLRTEIKHLNDAKGWHQEQLNKIRTQHGGAGEEEEEGEAQEGEAQGEPQEEEEGDEEGDKEGVAYDGSLLPEHMWGEELDEADAAAEEFGQALQEATDNAWGLLDGEAQKYANVFVEQLGNHRHPVRIPKWYSPCKYFVRNRCWQGLECPFSHAEIFGFSPYLEILEGLPSKHGERVVTQWNQHVTLQENLRLEEAPWAKKPRRESRY